ncbi:hypothetical protein EJ08DRAFT_240750 [Tothia fuscella]|uniref:Amino acid transporter transmembrane domain-containing protein n=1 Tax=Tothia fuscella TaxID=1048955 RepID=A0A9P4NS21_9PEZI|nr:hypothetical protein EJ08DRAFT_240750 [Tothia fuscella]
MNVPASGKQPATWQDYQQGSRQGSFGSTNSHVQWEDDTSREVSRSPPHDHGNHEALRRRRSSTAVRLNAFVHAGGVNSIDNFARSWQRAAGFYEITPVRPTFRFDDDDAEETGEPSYSRQNVAASPEESRSLLRSALMHESRRISDNVLDDDSMLQTPTTERPNPTGDPGIAERLGRRRSRGESIFSIEPSLDSPFGGSYGTTYGSLASRANRLSMRHAAHLFNEQQLKGVTEPDKGREPLLVKTIEEDGVAYNVVVGQSTLYQTIFNSVNVLIGVGILSLPLAIHYSGWVIGMLFFAFAVVTTHYTAKLLAKCLDVDNSLITFADLAFVSFGPSARIWVSALFCIELIAANVALVVLFADSLDALIPGIGVLGWKLIAIFVLTPLAFLPLNLLSFTSILGILSCFGIVGAVFIDGLIKPHYPGSLREPAPQYLFPQSWGTVPLALGLLMSPWGGHSVFPNIYRDMRHPYKYHRGLNITYSFTYLLDVGMACIGILMFGDSVRDEITSNVLLTKGYPQAISIFIVVCIAIIPVTKVPLNARPIISTLEILCGLDTRALASNSVMVGMSAYTRGLLKAFIRILTTILFVGIAIIFPAFDRIMTLLGSVCCFSICIILPLAFHLKLFGKELGRGEFWVNWALIGVSSVMAVVSTVFACLPRDLIGA